MNVLNFVLGRRSASVARDRLRILLAQERSDTHARYDLLSVLREEILQVVSRHVELDRDRIKIRAQRGHNVSTLEIDIEIPRTARVRLAVGL